MQVWVFARGDKQGLVQFGKLRDARPQIGKINIINKQKSHTNQALKELVELRDSLNRGQEDTNNRQSVQADKVTSDFETLRVSIAKTERRTRENELKIEEIIPKIT